MMLYPTVVLLPQWVIDDINRAISALDETSDRFLFTDEMRANGWTREMVIGGMTLAAALRATIDQT